MAFQFKTLDIPGVVYIQPDVHGDERGFLMEVYKFREFKDHGVTKPFVQVNHSKSSKNVLRGLHYQKNPLAQGKLITVVEGEIFDAAVDIRAGSPTYGRWTAMTLDARKKNMLYIPEGFAHGFCVLSDTAQVIYYCTEVYSRAHEAGLLWDDPTINISWPVAAPILSDKDRVCPQLGQIENNFVYAG
jgi:dTDP-4-dehydrorhamnose 3,5-epimerase